MADALKKVNLNIKIDPKLKLEADHAFKEMGMNTSVAVNMFLTRVVEDGEFPFVPKYNKETQQAISEVEQDKTKKFKSVKSLFDDLNDES
jgi:DNA-damage-inducible protein J